MASWPEEKNVPVLSTVIADILLKKDIIETGEEGGKIPFNCYGEEIFRLKHNENFYEIPKNLTSKGTLHFLGFRPSEVGILWHYAINRQSPTNEPITQHRAYGFWKGVNEYLDDKFRNLIRRNTWIQMMDTKQVLDAIGLRSEVQSQSLTIKNEVGGKLFLSLQNQNPRSVIAWAKRYIKRRWSVLADLEIHINSRPGDGWLLDIVREFNEHPVDTDSAYTMDFSEPLLDMDATPEIIKTTTNTLSNKEELPSIQRSSDKKEIFEDLYKW